MIDLHKFIASAAFSLTEFSPLPARLVDTLAVVAGWSEEPAIRASTAAGALTRPSSAPSRNTERLSTTRSPCNRVCFHRFSLSGADDATCYLEDHFMQASHHYRAFVINDALSGCLASPPPAYGGSCLSLQQATTSLA